MPAETRVITIELRDLAHDIVNALLTGFPSPALREAIERVLRADALIAVTVPTAVFAATEEWGAAGGDTGALTARIDRAGAELAALAGGRVPEAEADPYASVTPLEQFLRDH